MAAFLLLGVERDGVVLLSSLIAAHPDLAWLGSLERRATRGPSAVLGGEAAGDAPRGVGYAIHADFAWAVRRWPAARFVFVGRSSTRAKAERAAERDWRRVAAEIPRTLRHEVRYERLLLDLRGECARLCAFLGVTFSTELLRRPLRVDALGVARPWARVAARTSWTTG